MNDDTRAIISSIQERQNAFEETAARFFQEMAALRHDMQIITTNMQLASAKSDARWADTQADLKELQFENQRILKWLENQQRSQ